MQAILTSLIAVTGTLLGSSLTYLFQSRASGRAERFTRDERLRQERMTVYSAFVGAVFELRRKHADQWTARVEASTESPAYKEAKAAQVTSRLAAYQALAKVQLVTDDDHVAELARTALQLTADLNKASSSDELGSRATAIRKAVEDFIAAASTHVR